MEPKQKVNIRRHLECLRTVMVERICKYKQIDDEHLAPDAIMGLLGSNPHEGPTFTPRMLAKRKMKTTIQGWIPRYQP